MLTGRKKSKAFKEKNTMSTVKRRGLLMFQGFSDDELSESLNSWWKWTMLCFPLYCVFTSSQSVAPVGLADLYTLQPSINILLFKDKLEFCRMCFN